MFLLRGKSPPRSSLLPQANACYRCLTLPLLLGGRNCLPPKTPSSSLVNKKKESQVIAIMAPAVAVKFKGKDLKLNGWFKSAGVKSVFDVSFGAELTTKT